MKFRHRERKEKMKKMIIFLPIFLVTLIFVTIIYYAETLPQGPDIYIFFLLNILAAFLMQKNEVKSRLGGIICGLMSGIYMWILSLSNWKVDIELYIGVFFIILYLLIGLFFLYSDYKMKLNRKE